MKAIALAVFLAFAGAQHDLAAATAGLHSPDPAERTRAACDLRRLGGNAAPALSSLASLLDDGSPVDPAVCGDRTWRGRGAELSTSPGEQAASALVAIGHPAYATLVQAVGNPAWIARKNAVWALGALGDRAAVPVVTSALRDAEPRVRSRSAWALGALDASEAVTALIGALSDTDAGVREQAAWALGAIGDRAAVDALTKALTDASASVREQAAWALGALGDDRAVSALSKALKDPEARVRRQAAWALGAIGG